MDTGTLSEQASSASTSSTLLSTLHAYDQLTKALFTSIANPAARTASVRDQVAGLSWSCSSTNDIVEAIEQVDQLLSRRIHVARQHSYNQRQIESLKNKAIKRDCKTRRAIAELNQMSNELDDIVKLSHDQEKLIEVAEKEPISYDTLLSYAQKLSRYTSAPPGYKLPKVEDMASKTQDETKNDQENHLAEASVFSLGPDYNQFATRAAAYYDPAMPSMPQEMPFPSDAMMRQGILNSQALLAGAPMAEEPPAAMEEDLIPEPEFVPAYSSLHVEQQRQKQEEEEDAFDLDLN